MLGTCGAITSNGCSRSGDCLACEYGRGAVAHHLDAALAFAKDGPDVIDVHAARAALAEGAAIVDVRNPDEVARVRLPGATNVPLPELSAGRTDGLPEDRHAPVVTICAAGVRSLYARSSSRRRATPTSAGSPAA